MKRALVTGGSRGIGLALVERLLALGYSVNSVSRDGHVPPALLREYGSRVVGVAADLGDVAARANVVAELLGKTLDVLVLSAGIAEYADAVATSDALLEKHLAVNFESGFALVRDLSPQLAKDGAVVVVSSTLAETTAPRTAAYAASKAALLSAMRSFALELGPRGIRVNAISPGIVETDMLSARSLEDQKALLALHPLGHFVSVLDVADAMQYLLESPFVTATNLTLDAGLTLRS